MKLIYMVGKWLKRVVSTRVFAGDCKDYQPGNAAYELNGTCLLTVIRVCKKRYDCEKNCDAK